MRKFASVLFAVAHVACGPLAAVSNDAGPEALNEEAADAGTPIPEADAGTSGCVTYPAASTSEEGPLTVTVYDKFGEFDLTATVVHHLRDGSVAGVYRPDANGQATFPVRGGDAVSVAREYDYAQQVFTWLAVQPKDNLVAGVAQKPAAVRPYGMVRLRYPGTWPGAMGYRSSAGCETAATSSSSAHPSSILFLDTPCNASLGNFVPLWGAALDGNNRLLAYVANPRQGLTLQNQEYVGTFQPASWKTDFLTVTATATDLATLDRLEASAEWLTPGNERFSLPVAMGTTVGTHEVRVPRGLGALYHHLFAVNVPERTRGTRRVNVLKTATPPSTWGGSAKSWFLPEVVGSEAKVVPGAPGQRDIRWETLRCMENVQAILMTTRWASNGNDTRWTVVGPPTHGPIRLPQLPKELASFVPPEEQVLAPSMAFLHSSKLSGWNDVRARFTELPKVREERLLDRTLFPGLEHELRLSILF